jgi:hypothetical protein
VQPVSPISAMWSASGIKCNMKQPGGRWWTTTAQQLPRLSPWRVLLITVASTARTLFQLLMAHRGSVCEPPATPRCADCTSEERCATLPVRRVPSSHCAAFASPVPRLWLGGVVAAQLFLTSFHTHHHHSALSTQFSRSYAGLPANLLQQTSELSTSNLRCRL